MLGCMRWLAIALALLALACEEPADRSEPPASAETPPAEDTETVEAAEAEPGPWIDVDAESLAGALREHEAPYLLVNVWSTWCEPCVEEMPAVVATGRRYEARGLGLVLISADAPSQRDAAHAFLAEHGAPMPSYFKTGSDDAFIEALHAEWSGALPATLLLDRARRVVHFWPGPVDEASLRDPIETLLGEEG